MNEDTITEMKDLPALAGSLNVIVSQQHSLYRPASLSDSCAFTPENVQRANKDLRESLLQRTNVSEERNDLQIVPQNEPIYSHEQFVVELVIKLSLHIALISVFETVFFFFFVSSLENSGIHNTVDSFVNDAVNACRNLTSVEIIIVDDFLEKFMNTSSIANQAAIEYNNRMIYNTVLFHKAWLYVGLLAGLFVIITIYARIRKLRIAWKRIIPENIIMVILLALYEYMFFKTVIFPYKAISSQEIEQNAITEMQTTCGILTYQ